MRKSGLFIALVLFVFTPRAATFPVPMPNVGEARVKIVGQNLQNYFINLDNSFSSSSTPEQFQTKTNKIVATFLAADADIYAMCELEVSDTVVGHLTAAMNAVVGEARYAYVHDALRDAADGATKSGFIYRQSTIRPVGNIQSSSSTNVYKKRLRWQLFEEIESGERFVVSMNHFKAKSVSDDSTTNSQRMTNAKDLYSAMSRMRQADPDIIVLGDLNCQVDEDPIQYLINTAELEEILLLYDPSAYSHSYNGRELIDHVMANESAKSQITGAGLCHSNTSYSAYRFSDHDLYMVGLFENTEETSIESIKQEPRVRKCMENGQLYILQGGKKYTIMGVFVK